MKNTHPSPTPHPWRTAIVQYIAEHPDRPLRARALGRELGVPPDEAAAFRNVLRELLDEGQLTLGRGRTLSLPEARGGIVGVYRATRRGFGFVESPGRPDLFIPRHAARDALDGDTVSARLVTPRQRGDEPHGEIVRVLERAPVRWVGVLERRGAHWVVQPQGKAPAPLVSIDDPAAKDARPGDLVAVEPLSFTLGTPAVRGVIVERIGPPGETLSLILAVIHRHSLPHEFPQAVRAAAQQASASFVEDELPPEREDLRETLTLTIDPPDARDFDDAISIEHLPGGQTRLGVHIADVAHFVPSGGALDVEALDRGNSVYFPGYVVPMLPEVLSNGVCSLQPGRTRLTKSVFITFDSQARPVEARFANSAIRSAARLTYEQVTAFLDEPKAGPKSKPASRRAVAPPASIAPPVAALLRSAEKLARAIRQRRIADGMIVLSVPDAEIVLDEQRRVIDSRPEDTSFSHTIIEMFMVEANEAVSRLLWQSDITHLRRIHPPPTPESTERFARLAVSLGRPMESDLSRAAIRKLLDDVRDKPEAPTINYLLLRSLAQASYSPVLEGHFALASEHYCHFTSPIRRYPDLVNHRLVERLLNARRAKRRGERHADDVPGDLVDLGRHCSMTERRAQDAERDAKSALLVELMKDKIGDVFDGVITGVVSVGVFVQIWPYLAEGLIHKSEFGPDRWEFEDGASRFVARRSGRVLHLGIPVRVQLVRADSVRQELAFAPLDTSDFGQIRTISGGERRGKAERSRAATGKRPRAAGGRKRRYR